MSRSLGPLVERALGVTELRRLHERLPSADRPFWDAALNALKVGYTIHVGNPDRIPRTGALIAIANHPLGGLDGLVLLALLARIRPDVKLLGNYVLQCFPGLRPTLIPVDPFNTRTGRSVNRAAARAAIQWLQSGGALAMFPSGEVAHEIAAGGSPIDSEWSPGAARLAQSTNATIVPVFFHAGNSRLFRLAGRLHPLVRTALLPRELLRKRGHEIAVSIDAPIPAAQLARFQDAEQATAYLRLRTDALGGSVDEPTPSEGSAAEPHPAPVGARGSPDVLDDEIRALRPSGVLLQNGAFDVCLAHARQIPRTLLEIGRLRELAFRAAGEGSGKPRDLDTFDEHYLHLFVWHRERREIAGAYRMGGTDTILPRFRVQGLYTSTLFEYDERLLAQIDPALELGRAFVAPGYQRDRSPLLLLWKGIATYVYENPRYRMLFGPVSISNSYQSLSRQILARFLYATTYRPDLGQLVTARHTPGFLRQRGRLACVAGPVVRTLADVGALLTEIEADQKGVPVLVRQYLKLNARLLGFNVDPAFGGALDGLMLVDLTDVDRAILARYMGAARADEYLGMHGAVRRRAS